MMRAPRRAAALLQARYFFQQLVAGVDYCHLQVGVLATRLDGHRGL